MEGIKPGQLVISVAGRDKGKYYIIRDILNVSYVLVVDGKYKTLLKPKKKNILHLQKMNDISGDFIESMESGNLNDSLIGHYIKEMVQARQEKGRSEI